MRPNMALSNSDDPAVSRDQWIRYLEDCLDEACSRPDGYVVRGSQVLADMRGIADCEKEEN